MKPQYYYVYSCSSCPVDMDKPGTCDVCGRYLIKVKHIRKQKEQEYGST